MDALREGIENALRDSQGVRGGKGNGSSVFYKRYLK
jgi:hypothetical protein